MLQSHDRVLNSRSTDTLLMLVIISAAGLIVFAILDYIRARVYLVMGNGLARRLNLPTLQAAVAETLEGQSGRAPQVIRDLNDLRSFLTGSAISVPLERSEEHTSELQSLMRISYAVFCLKKKKKHGR